MIRCSIAIPLKSWRLEDDIFEHMTLYSWYSCRGKDCSIMRRFNESVAFLLNRVSGRNNTYVHVWYPRIIRGIVHINLITSEDISIKYFREQFNGQVLDKLKSLEIHSQKVRFNFEDKFYSTIEMTPCADDIFE